VGYRAISTGNSHCTMVFLSNAYQGSGTRLQLQPGANDTLVVIGCDAKADVIPATGLQRAAEHLDNLARLSEVFLSVNYPGSIEGTATRVPVPHGQSSAWIGSLTRRGNTLLVRYPGTFRVEIFSPAGRAVFAGQGVDKATIDLPRILAAGTCLVKLIAGNDARNPATARCDRILVLR
jgi:hypothetical protein